MQYGAFSQSCSEGSSRSVASRKRVRFVPLSIASFWNYLNDSCAKKSFQRSPFDPAQERHITTLLHMPTRHASKPQRQSRPTSWSFTLFPSLSTACDLLARNVLSRLHLGSWVYTTDIFCTNSLSWEGPCRSHTSRGATSLQQSTRSANHFEPRLSKAARRTQRTKPGSSQPTGRCTNLLKKSMNARPAAAIALLRLALLAGLSQIVWAQDTKPYEPPCASNNLCNTPRTCYVCTDAEYSVAENGYGGYPVTAQCSAVVENCLYCWKQVDTVTMADGWSSTYQYKVRIGTPTLSLSPHVGQQNARPDAERCDGDRLSSAMSCLTVCSYSPVCPGLWQTSARAKKSSAWGSTPCIRWTIARHKCRRRPLRRVRPAAGTLLV